jgi:hypothetical protein
MFWLVDEMYRQRGNTIQITLGKPVSSTHFTEDLSDAQWADYMKEKVYELGKQND